MTAKQAIERQITAAYETLGGFGHPIFIGRSGHPTHAEAENCIRLLAREVLPRLREATRQPVLPAKPLVPDPRQIA